LERLHDADWLGLWVCTWQDYEAFPMHFSCSRNCVRPFDAAWMATWVAKISISRKYHSPNTVFARSNHHFCLLASPTSPILHFSSEGVGRFTLHCALSLGVAHLPLSRLFAVYASLRFARAVRWPHFMRPGCCVEAEHSPGTSITLPIISVILVPRNRSG
jgi:hypothetical protein